MIPNIVSRKKNPQAQRRVKEEAERLAWRRESQQAEQDELTREEQRWHPASTSKPLLEENEPPESSNTPARKTSRPESDAGVTPGDNSIAKSPVAKDKSPAEQCPSEDPVRVFEHIVGIVQDLQQRINAPSAATEDSNQREGPRDKQDIIHEGLTRVVNIVQNSFHDADTGLPATSSRKAPEPSQEGPRRGSATLAILRALDAVNRIVSLPQQTEQEVERSERPATSVTAVEEGSGSQPAEPPRESDPSAGPTGKDLKKEEKKKAKDQKNARKTEKHRIKEENKDAKKANKANKARKNEDKERERKEKQTEKHSQKKGKERNALDDDLPHLPTLTASAAAAPTADAPGESGGPSQPIGGDGAVSLPGSSSSSSRSPTRSLGSAVFSPSFCYSSRAPWAPSSCRCDTSHRVLNGMSSSATNGRNKLS